MRFTDTHIGVRRIILRVYMIWQKKLIMLIYRHWLTYIFTKRMNMNW